MSERSPNNPWTIESIEALAPDGKSITAARELLKADTFPQIEPTADGRGWWAVCQGTTDLYRVAVRCTEYGFAYECSCPSRKEPCKHALALLLHLTANPALRVSAEPAQRAPMDFEGLLRAVFANPDDDTPRLIFADYLDENGQPDRAALIRVQCEHVRLPGDDPRVAELGETEEEVLTRVREQIGNLPEEFDLTFQRGFVQLGAGPGVFRNVASLPARVANLFLDGWVESVRFYETFRFLDGDAYALLRRAGELNFSRVRQDDLDLVQLAMEVPAGVEGQRLARVRVHPDDESLFRAFASNTLAPKQESRPPIWEHHYSLQSITPDHLERLLRAGRLEGITQLSFYNPSFGDRGVEVLAEGDLSLNVLFLSGAGVGPAGAAALAEAGWFPRLNRLSVRNCPFVNEGVAALGRPFGTCTLDSLELTSVGVGDAGIAEFARSERFPSLDSLDLSGNDVTEVGAAKLLASEHFPKLQRLEFDRNPIPAALRVRLVLEARDRPALAVAFGKFQVTRTREPEANDLYRVGIRAADPAALAALSESTGLHRVAALALEDSAITPEAAAGIAKALSPETWRALDLTGCSLGEKPAAVVERFLAGHHLAALDLTYTGLKYADVFKIAQNPAISSVKRLDLSGNPMGTGGLEALLASPHLRGVERFVLKELNLTQRDRLRFQKEFGKRAEF